jgi:hypothetical protein
MTRPLIDPTQLVSGMEAWDALLRDILSVLAVTPSPVPRYSSSSAFPSAGDYDGCLVVAEDTGNLHFSKGGVWTTVTVTV